MRVFLAGIAVGGAIVAIVSALRAWMWQPYAIFRRIPYRRVNDTVNPDEIIDLYQMGEFITDASFFPGLAGQTVGENVDLVEMTPHSTYRPHIHAHSDAVIYIADGTGVFLLGDARIPYQKGTRVHIPAGTAHGFVTELRTLFLSIQTPSIIDPVTGDIDLYYPDQE